MNVKDAFAWEHQSYFQYFLETFRLSSPPQFPLKEIDELQKLSMSDFKKNQTHFESVIEEEQNPFFALTTTHCTPLHRAIAYLAKYSDPKLENLVREKFNEIKENHQKQLNAVLRSIFLFSVTQNRMKMIDVCEKILSLDLLKKYTPNDPSEIAKIEAKFVERPREDKAEKKQAVFSFQRLQPFKWSKWVHYVILTTTLAYSINLDEPPRSRWAAQSQWTIFRELVSDSNWIATTFIHFFPTLKKAAIAGIAALGVIGILSYYLKNKMGNIVENLDKNYFTNWTAEGSGSSGSRIRRVRKRASKDNIMDVCMTSPPGEPPLIGFYIGEPGIGKTFRVKDLAERIKHGEIPALKGFQLYAVNTEDLKEQGDWSDEKYLSRVDALFKAIRGQEDRVIIFFDEVGNAPNKGGGNRVNLLEQLKTKLIERGIRGIFATTLREYNESIAPNTAFVDRTFLIELSSLESEKTKSALLKNVKESPFFIPTEAKAYDQVLFQTSTHPYFTSKANPRKSLFLLQLARNYVHGWIPKKLEIDLEELFLKKDVLETEVNELRAEDRNWFDNEEGKIKRQEMQNLEQEITILQEKIRKQTKLHELIFNLRKLESFYSKQEAQAIHHLKDLLQDDPGLSQAQGRLLFYKYVLLPLLQKEIENQAILFKDRFGEEMPLRVTADIVKKVASYPAVLPHTPLLKLSSDEAPPPASSARSVPPTSARLATFNSNEIPLRGTPDIVKKVVPPSSGPPHTPLLNLPSEEAPTPASSARSTLDSARSVPPTSARLATFNSNEMPLRGTPDIVKKVVPPSSGPPHTPLLNLPSEEAPTPASSARLTTLKSSSGEFP